jgi:Uncharacterized protein conserved in bacteria (DUF2188)
MGGETHVVPNPGGGWDVVVPGANERESHHGTQRAAESHAKQLLRKQGGGEAVIHGRDGRIRDSDVVKGSRNNGSRRGSSGAASAAKKRAR